ncbi:hypothetical protein BH10BAC3_BH10BAC3_38900 [soil metagenome]
MNAKHNIWQLSYWSQTWAGMPVKQRRLFGGIMLVHFIFSLLYTLKQGVLFDEPDYYNYVFHWATGQPERNFPIMDSKTPMMAFSLIPVVLKPLLPDHLLAKDIFFYLKAGRPFMYAYQLLGAFVVCCWLYRKAGFGKWILPLLFFCFDPLIFCYGMVVGSDLASAALLVTTMYAAWRFTQTKNNRYWYVVCFAAALAVVTKASMVYCYPLLLLLFAYFSYKHKSLNYKKTFLQLLAFVIIQLVVINLAYYGKGSFTPFGNIHFASQLFGGIQSATSFLHAVPVPFPAAFIQGFDMLQQHAEIGGCKPESTYQGVWIFNKIYCDTSVWYYYLATALFKFPLFIWLIIIATFVRFFRTENKREQLKENIFAWLPIIYFLFILSFANKFQIGIRHTIIVMPFLYIGLSNTINELYDKYKPLFYTLLLLHVISVGSYLPNLIAYTNELVWNKTKAYRIIRDSSLDYGQSGPWVNDFIEENKAYKIPANMPDTGKFAITVADLFATHMGPLKNIAWLRENFEPVSNYRHTILLFDITAADVKAKGLTIKEGQ